jgi:hypothetical protein
MKHRFVRFGGLSILAFALAACSGGSQGVTPDAVSMSQDSIAAPAADHMQAGELAVSPSAVDMARHFRPMGKPHVTYTRLKNPFKNLSKRGHASPVGYPLDMTLGSGPVVTSIAAYNVYVNCPAKNESCWGHPEEFLKGLAGSPLSNLVTQYTGGAGSAYTYGGSVAVKYTGVNSSFSNTYYNNDLFAILATAAKHFQKIGLTAEYHIFLPQGIDTCFDQPAQCYSPDNLSSFAFCAYHSAVSFNGTPVLYSVEPYQDAKIDFSGQSVYACQNSTVPKGTNRLDSGTASTLSHESFETWSDPIPNSGWFNANYGAEIGDICAYQFMDEFKLGGKTYYLQQEYSNTYHGCASGS